MFTNTKSTNPGQAQDADGGHRPTEQAVISCTQYHDDSPVGPIHVIASIQVTELVEDEEGPRPFIDVKLSVEAEFTEDQPDVWSVEYVHYASVIFGSMGKYLNDFCPAPDEVLKTFWSLDFPAEVSTEVEKYRPEAIA